MYVKGFAIDDTKVDEEFAPRLPKEKLWGVYLDLVDQAKLEFDIVLAERSGHRTYLPYVLVLASDDDRGKLEATPIEKDPKTWLEPFLEKEAGVFRRY